MPAVPVLAAILGDDMALYSRGMDQTSGRSAGFGLTGTGLRAAPRPVGAAPAQTGSLSLGGGYLGSVPQVAAPVTGMENTLQLGGNTSAASTFASLSRLRYNDYLRRYRGIENEQIAFATDKGRPLAEANKAIGLVQGAFGRIPGQEQRRAERMGLDANPEVAAANKSRTALTGSLAAVTGANRAAQSTYDQQGAVFGGGSATGLIGR